MISGIKALSLIAAISVTLALAIPSAGADMTVKVYRQMKVLDETTKYVGAVGAGLKWYNSTLVANKTSEHRLYCQPDRSSLSPEDYVSVLDATIVKKTAAGKNIDDTAIEALLLYGLMDMFPCK